jgi:hypothetical protein
MSRDEKIVSLRNNIAFFVSALRLKEYERATNVYR